MLDWLADYDGPLFDSCVTDPPYELGFMGKSWDSSGIAFQVETWRRVYDALKPGAHLVAFSGTRTYHRMACAIEDAGFEIRDQLKYDFATGTLIDSFFESLTPAQADAFQRIMDALAPGQLAWEYGSGFPKSHNLKGKWQGWGSALKPAWEPICLARKPLGEKNIAANVLRHGTGAINVDGCRVGTEGARNNGRKQDSAIYGDFGPTARVDYGMGRFPANLIHDGSEEVLAGFPETGASNGQRGGGERPAVHEGYQRPGGSMFENKTDWQGVADSGGSAARFFYSAKAGPLDRIGTAHATVKPVDLMRWLERLVTPPGGHILEPFAGSGTTGIAAMAEGFDCTMIELEADHAADIERKLAYLRGQGGNSIIEKHKARIDRTKAKPDDLGPLFGDAA